MSEVALRQSITAALRVTPRDERLGSAVWLYLQLLSDCNHRGLVCRRLERLALEVAASEEQIVAWLGVLHGAGLIVSETAAPFLVIRITSWPRASAKCAATYGFRSTQPIEGKGQSDGHSPVDSELMREVLETLGESDPAPFQGALRHYAPGTIRKALERVRAAGSVRKSRTALFRYLLPKLNRHD